jgi:hypothetical protein
MGKKERESAERWGLQLMLTSAQGVGCRLLLAVMFGVQDACLTGNFPKVERG